MIEFVDEPPPSQGNWDATRRRRVEEFAQALRANPGRWAAYPYQASSYSAGRAMASRIARGRIVAFGEGFTAVSRKGEVYVRYDKQSKKKGK